MEIKRFVEVVEEMGYEVNECTANKYGYDEQAFNVGKPNDTIRGCFYERDIVNMSEERLKDIIINNVEKRPNIDPDALIDKDYVLENVIMAIRASSDDESIVKVSTRGDLEVYFRVKVSLGEGMGSYKVTKDSLDRIGISKQELYQHALKNTEKEIEIISMTDMLREMGVPEGMMGETEDTKLYVATNKSRVNGAAVMECKDKLDDFCKKNEYKGIAIIPSSIHEVLLIPIGKDFDKDKINEMINEVNSSQVAPDERLSDHVYFHYVD